MKIEGIRLGKATNSSSAHAIIFCKPDCNFYTYTPDDKYYGWENFRLADRSSKLDYLATMLVDQALPQELPLEIRQSLASIVIGEPVDPLEGIDHQSRWTLPKYNHNHELAVDYVRELFFYIANNPRWVIFGGNDNNTYDDALTDFGDEKSSKQKKLDDVIGLCRSWFNVVCARWGDWWVLYDRDTGTKLRVSFKDNPEPYLPEHPEMVDLCITKYCPHSCSFCYMDSIQNNWTYQNLEQSLDFFKGGVPGLFELVLGGGEPTLFPHLQSWLTKLAKHYSLGITTRNLDFLSNYKLRDAMFEHCAAIAVSDLGTARPSEDPSHRTRYKIMEGEFQGQRVVHIIDGICCDHELAHLEQLKDYWRYCALGYKLTGRANPEAPNTRWFQRNQSDLTKFILKQKLTTDSIFKGGKTPWLFTMVGTISIDGSYLKTHRETLLAAGVCESLLETQDGVTSCFVDLVDSRIGPSSYEPDLWKPFGKGGLSSALKRERWCKT